MLPGRRIQYNLSVSQKSIILYYPLHPSNLLIYQSLKDFQVLGIDRCLLRYIFVPFPAMKGTEMNLSNNKGARFTNPSTSARSILWIWHTPRRACRSRRNSVVSASTCWKSAGGGVGNRTQAEKLAHMHFTTKPQEPHLGQCQKQKSYRVDRIGVVFSDGMKVVI